MIDFLLDIALIVVICVVVYIVMEKVYERIPPKLSPTEPDVTINAPTSVDVETVIKRSVTRAQQVGKHRQQ